MEDYLSDSFGENLDEKNQTQDGLIFFKNLHRSPIRNNSSEVSFKGEKIDKNKNQCPQNLLNVKGIEFYNNKQFAKDFFQPYANVMNGKYNKFFNFCNKIIKINYNNENINDLESFEVYEIDLLDKICYTSTRVGEYGDQFYNYEEDTNCIRINVDYPNKEEAFVAGNLRRLCNKGIALNEDNNCLVKKNGFCRKPVDEKIRQVNDFDTLYEGTLLHLTNEVIKSVNKSGLKVLTQPTRQCKHPNELITVAKFIRDFVNLNNNPANSEEVFQYNYKNDSLLYDLFVNGEIKNTRTVMDQKCGTGTFDMLYKYIKEVFSKDKDFLFKENYSNLLNLFIWLQKTSK